MVRSSELRRNSRRIIGIVRLADAAPAGTRIANIAALGVRQAAVGRKVGMRMRGGLARSRSGTGRRGCAAIVALGLSLGGCFGETFQRGYVLPDGALEQIPLGASQEQVLLVLGTPSTVATVSGEAFYYISQRAERPISFLQTKITDQRVIAVYFDKNRGSSGLPNTA